MHTLLLGLMLVGCDDPKEVVEDNIDTDGDGLTDAEELELGTDPLIADTDGDG